MNVNALIDAIVHQTTVLIAQLATAAGVRAPLAHVADRVFLDLVTELRSQGVGGKVIADMFGMALRTYHARVRRLRESVSDQGRTLWEAVLGYIQEHALTSRKDVLHRFRYDDEPTVRGVLNDLMESGLVFKSGRGANTVYRAAEANEVQAASDPVEADAILAWVAINRFQPASRDDIAGAVHLGPEALDAALARLEADGRVTATETAGERRWRTDACLIPYGAPVGWEAAVFDHYQAMVTGVCTKLRRGATVARRADAVGGSTWGFDVWQDHPLEDEVYALFSEVRQKAGTLFAKVEAHNTAHPRDAALGEPERLMFYVGQSIRAEEEDA
jgi:hypothetical protein